MKLLLTIIFITRIALAGIGQDSVRHRIILIGDAGEINDLQSKTLTDAASLVMPGKTTVLFLGDNIYPRGMGLPGSREENRTTPAEDAVDDQ